MFKVADTDSHVVSNWFISSQGRNDLRLPDVYITKSQKAGRTEKSASLKCSA
jgi:hypothetical protein